jgi:uncharacterized protein
VNIVHKHTTAINIILGAIVIGLGALLLLIPRVSDTPKLQSIYFPSGHSISIEVVDNVLSRAQGLSGRESINENYGMLFIHDEPNIPTFWMKGMNFPIDIIWIRNGVVVGIEKEVPIDPGISADLYSPEQEIDMVLEVKAGFSDMFDVKIGDILDIRAVSQ